MKFTCERKAALDAITLARRAAEARSPICVLANLLLVVEKNRLKISATNVDRAITASVQASGTKNGSTTANAEQIALFVKNAPDGSQVEGETKDGRLILRAARARISLPLIPPEDFPDLHTGIEYSFSCQMDGRELADALGFVAHAQGGDPNRSYLTGIFLHEDKGVLAVVASDSISLAKTTIEGPHFAKFPGIILPREYVQDIRDLAARCSDLKIEASLTRFCISGEGASLSTKLIEGTFPPQYPSVIPWGSPKRFSASRTALEASAIRCAGLAEGIDRTLRLSLDNGVLILSASSSTGGDVVDEADVEAGEPFTIGTHVLRFQKALAAFKSASIEVTFEDGAAMMLRDPAKPDAVQAIAQQRP